MKKLFAIFFIGLMCISGCKKEGDTSISKDQETTSSSITQNILSSSSTNDDHSIKYELATPILTLNDKNGVVEWKKVDGAEYYNYIINDGELLTTTETLIELEDKSNVSVQAIGNNKYSKWSSAITYYDTSDKFLEGNGKMHSVYFYGSNIETVKVLDKTKVNRPNDPSRPNCTFDNWYADPFYTTLFDFDTIIRESTIIYAHYIKNPLIEDVYYWIKANEKMTSEIQSSFTSNSGWKFIPLKEDTTSNIKEFVAYVTVSNASTTSPCQFLIMDGFDDNAGRTYYKNGDSDYKIIENGTYKITFSVETLYLLDGNQVNAKYELVNVASLKNSYYLNSIQLDTPVVTIDESTNMATFPKVPNADKYEVIINNSAIKTTTTNKVRVNKGEHISIRAVKDDSIYSNWSIPKANINYIYIENIEEETHAYVYFYESNQDAICVEKNTKVNEIPLEKDGYTFLGWYLDIARTKKATFPYLVKENTIFYPKWEDSSDFLTKEYYELVDSSNNRKCGLTLNIDKYDYYEYEAKGVSLSFGENYYVKSLKNNKTWGPYTVDESSTYNLYFSEDHIWDVNTDKARNIYFENTQKTIYFTDVKGWTDTIYAYAWNSATNKNLSTWPGIEMTYLQTNSYNQEVYTITIDISKYDMIIFSHGSNNVVVTQTIDISLKNTQDNGFYVTEKDSNGKYEIGTYKR